MDARVVGDRGTDRGAHGASWSYLVEGTAQQARLRSWQLHIAAGWHVDHTRMPTQPPVGASLPPLSLTRETD